MSRPLAAYGGGQVGAWGQFAAADEVGGVWVEEVFSCEGAAEGGARRGGGGFVFRGEVGEGFGGGCRDGFG